MSVFKKVLCAAAAFLAVVLLFSAILAGPFLYLETHYHGDTELKVGSVDALLCGASQCQLALIPDMINEEFGVCSYNLSATAATVSGREALLRAEAKRNDISTVVVEFTADALHRQRLSQEGDMCVLPKLPGLKAKTEFLLSHCPLNDLDDIYAYCLFQGVSTYRDILFGDWRNTTKGFKAFPSVDLTLTEEQIAALYNSNTEMEAPCTGEMKDSLKQLLDFCEETFENVIIVSVPVSDAMIWEYTGWDSSMNVLKEMCRDYGFAYYDFNLLRNRYELFNDRESYSDINHMSEAGATELTRVFCETVKMAGAGEDTSGLFYDSYEDMKRDSPYMAY